jgi:hypothetical protein
MKEDEPPIPKRWKLLPHAKTHRVLVIVVLIVVVALLIKVAS